jgi:hypothetical protein
LALVRSHPHFSGHCRRVWIRRRRPLHRKRPPPQPHEVPLVRVVHQRRKGRVLRVAVHDREVASAVVLDDGDLREAALSGVGDGDGVREGGAVPVVEVVIRHAVVDGPAVHQAHLTPPRRGRGDALAVHAQEVDEVGEGDEFLEGVAVSVAGGLRGRRERLRARVEHRAEGGIRRRRGARVRGRRRAGEDRGEDRERDGGGREDERER